MTISKTTHRLTMHDFEHATVKVTATTSAFPLTAISFGMSGGLVLETMSCPASELADWLREKADEIDGANVAMYDHGCETGVGGMTIIRETCTCGASFEAESEHLVALYSLRDEFRRDHKDCGKTTVTEQRVRIGWR